MTIFPQSIRRLTFLFIVLLLLAGCGGLASEPEIIRTAALPTVTPTSPPDLGRPANRVDIGRGAAIYNSEQGCWLCHGKDGKGNGPTVQSNPTSFACPLPNFTDADAARGKSINAWFAITSNGNNGGPTCLMPPWKARLNEQQRWDVTSYLYSLHYTPDALAQGQTIWQDKCAACHGEQGAGNGPKAQELPRPVPNFTDPAYLIKHSDTDLWKTVTNGLGEVMPAFKDQLDDNARWAVVAYTRSLTWDRTEVAAATQAATAAPIDSPTITVRGKVTNGTANAAIPANLPLTLRVIDLSGSTPRDAQKVDTKTGDDGSFSFGELPRQINLVYVVTTQYAGLAQTNTPIRLQPGSGPTLDLSFQVFETTTDPAVIQVDVERLFFSPFSQTALFVQQGMSFANTGDRIFVTNPTGGNTNSVEIALPANAQQITLAPESAQCYAVNTGVIQRTIPIYPASARPLLQCEAQELLFTYTLPSSDRTVIETTSRYLVEELTVHTPQTSGLAIDEETFIPDQPLQLQDGVYNSYKLQRPTRAGETVRFTLLSVGQQAADRRLLLAVVLIVAVLTIIGMGAAILRLNRQPTAQPATFDTLVAQIAELDERFEKGQMPQATYEAERARMKAELAKRLGNR
ncbi:MAG: c-type cytochrome [Anaerolineae bacterium]|nr:c-type cytochrome [Anaerolineae bacterium]